MANLRSRIATRRILGVLFCGSLFFCLWFGQITLVSGHWLFQPLKIGQAANAQSPALDQLIQRGVDAYQAGDYRRAIAAWESALQDLQQSSDAANAAIVSEYLARATQQSGQSEQSIAYWQQAIALQQRLGDEQRIGRLMTEQAQTYRSLGQHWQAIRLLCGDREKAACAPGSAVEIARRHGDREGEAAALGSLGETYRLRGDYNQAIPFLEASLELSRELDNSLYITSALNALGSTYRNLAQVSDRRAASAEQVGKPTQAARLRQEGQKYDSQALRYFQESLALEQTRDNSANQLRTVLNLLPIYLRTGAMSEAEMAKQQAFSLLEKVPPSQDKVYATINLARILQHNSDEVSSKTYCSSRTNTTQATNLLKNAISTAQQLGDRRSESFALGELGHIYECNSDYATAMQLTQQARWAAEQNKDSRYLWEWQRGRIFRAQGDVKEAIAAYDQAITTLDTIRSDILTANRDIQFDFRDIIEPVYRQLVELRLSQEKPTSTGDFTEDKQNIDLMLNTIDSLKLAELQNYFGNDCVLTSVNPKRVDRVAAQANTAVFSSIVLDDRMAMIVSFPDGHQQLAQVEVDQNTLRKEINQYRLGLERFFEDFNLQQSQKIYNWLIQPFAPALAEAQIKTLVFIQDGILRSVPMAALHDGEKFLVERYAIATTPSLTLTASDTLKRQELRALALGLTEQTVVEGRSFPALINVNAEMNALQTELPGSKELLNQEFTRDRLQQELTRVTYPILHIATHGEFGTEPEDTFLITGNQQKLTINDLDTILRRSQRLGQIKLLVLTACQTATGDDRAALGLAGAAAQAGVESVLASLWFIDDKTTVEIVSQFYDGLINPNLSKAEALAHAQRSLIQAQAHPATWAPFILVGNWL